MLCELNVCQATKQLRPLKNRLLSPSNRIRHGDRQKFCAVCHWSSAFGAIQTFLYRTRETDRWKQRDIKCHYWSQKCQTHSSEY